MILLQSAAGLAIEHLQFARSKMDVFLIMIVISTLGGYLWGALWILTLSDQNILAVKRTVSGTTPR